MNWKEDKRCPFQLDALNFDSREHMFTFYFKQHKYSAMKLLAVKYLFDCRNILHRQVAYDHLVMKRYVSELNIFVSMIFEQRS